MQMDTSLSSIKVANQPKILKKYSISSITNDDSFSDND
jgi:hypothetical protein